MTNAGPIYATWNGEAFVPLRRHAKRCASEFVKGEIYPLDALDETPTGRDLGFHAEMRNLWQNLPEGIEQRFRSYDDFRNWSLIKCGFSSSTLIPCADEAAALRMLPKITPTEFSIVQIDGAIIRISRALSQKVSERRGGMARDDRYRSYDETLAYARELVGADERESREIAETVA